MSWRWRRCTDRPIDMIRRFGRRFHFIRILVAFMVPRIPLYERFFKVFQSSHLIRDFLQLLARFIV
ncbi:hypothetical protein K450DRAFT_259271 [Umbelopsis ramanniana AG]|uniref:Uncharacterized protein n=1 Tax=Umbelopsis ramanniana AG TaxID=1314678 RepID=A0AAD5E5H4_UMBRA|nr:uncharacterized protein K450DRAFT_259271 [Umbelopsis ramanniana AG]KAI8575980.1 hypothetical protein K450DRAFT_259271 [Umbelopsis ramanniana AG]